jgi:hypothetical protein
VVRNIRQGSAICIVLRQACVQTQRSTDHIETELGRPTRPTLVLCAHRQALQIEQ